MADQTETVTFTLPSGENVDAVIPAGLSDGAAKTYMLSRRPDLFQGMTANPAFKDTKMETSSLPGLVRGTANAMPIAGGAAGAIAGAPADIAGGAGSVIGGGLGATGGESLKQAILSRSFGEGPAPTSKKGLSAAGTSGAIAAASEAPTWLLMGGGRMILNRLANAQSAKEVGDAVQALKSVAPVGISQKGIKAQLDTAADKLGDKLGQQLSQTPGSADVDYLSQPFIQAAQSQDAAITQQVGRKSRAVTDAVNRSIALAKTHAGINGNLATAEQLESFRKILADKAFSAKTDYPTVSSAVQKLLQGMSSQSSAAVKILNPDTGPLYQQLTDIYAAQNAMKAYGMGRTESVLVSAVTHPRTTATIVPPVVAGIAIGGDAVLKPVRRLVGQ